MLCYAGCMLVVPLIRLLGVSVLLAASSAFAEEPDGGDVPARRHGVRIGVAQVSHLGVARSSGALAAELSYSFDSGRLRLPVEFTGGLRGALPRPGQTTLPAELFARAQLVARFGPWRPSLGPELGLTGLSRAPPRTNGFPPDLDALENERATPVYLAFDAAPLQFQFGPLFLSALELSMGSTLSPVGAVFRADVGLLHVGYAL